MFTWDTNPYLIGTQHDSNRNAPQFCPRVRPELQYTVFARPILSVGGSAFSSRYLGIRRVSQIPSSPRKSVDRTIINYLRNFADVRPTHATKSITWARWSHQIAAFSVDPARTRIHATENVFSLETIPPIKNFETNTFLTGVCPGTAIGPHNP